MATKNREEWLNKFYEGNFFVKGWNHHTKEVLKIVPPDEKEHVRELLDNLGNRIGPEWARENDIRRINNSMLKKWGNDLHTARRQGPDAVMEAIHSIESEADSILA